eukprot:scaffold40799_cov31-Cyclotella_meneghiniana.AAC.4
MECLHVGEPPSNFGSRWTTKMFYIHNFLDLPDAIGLDNVVRSPEFKCFNHTWALDVYPAGDHHAIEVGDEYISVYIHNVTDQFIVIDYDIAILKVDGSESQWTTSCNGIEIRAQGVYGDDLMKRSTLLENQLDYLDSGALAIKVMMRLSEGYYHNSIPQHLPVGGNMDIFQDEETSDVAFDLKGEIIFGHKCIIKSKAKDFYVMCEGYSVTSPMPITDVDNKIFEIMLQSLYGGDILPEEWHEHSEAILKAASKYGFSALESEADVWCAKSLNFTVDNVISKFMEADGNNHGRVKAAAKEFIMEHGEEVVASESFNNLYESKELMREVVTAAFQNCKKRKLVSE